MIFNVSNASGKTKIETVPSVASSLTYNGKEQSPTWLAYDPEQLTMTGVMSATNAGTYTVGFAPTKKYKWADGTSEAKFVEWTIAKASGSLSISKTSGTLFGKSGATTTFTVTRSGDGKISASSSDTSIATASVSGTTVTVTSKGYGSATITVSVAAGTNHKAPSNKTYSVTVSKLNLYSSGNEYESVTGGYATYINSDAGTEISVSLESNGINFYTYNKARSFARTNNKIDLSGVNKLTASIAELTARYTTFTIKLIVASNKLTNGDSDPTAIASKSYTVSSVPDNESATLTLDVSDVDSGYVYVLLKTSDTWTDVRFRVTKIVGE